ncbi:hypothetical protein N9064_00110 [bacterium]|nr:hypothetical protein [bacterium]
MFYSILLIVAIAIIFTFLTLQGTKESFENDQCVNVDYSVKVGPDQKHTLEVSMDGAESTFREFSSEQEVTDYLSGLLTNDTYTGCKDRLKEIVEDTKSIIVKSSGVNEETIQKLMDRLAAIEGHIIETSEDKEVLNTTRAIKDSIENGNSSSIDIAAEEALIEIETTKQEQLALKRRLLERDNLNVLAQLTKSEQELEARKNKIIELRNRIAVSEQELVNAKKSITYNANRTKEESVFVLNQYVTSLTRRLIELGLEITQYKLNKCEVCPLFTETNPVTLADVERLGLGLGSIVTDGRT